MATWTVHHVDKDHNEFAGPFDDDDKLKGYVLGVVDDCFAEEQKCRIVLIPLKPHGEG